MTTTPATAPPTSAGQTSSSLAPGLVAPPPRITWRKPGSTSSCWKDGVPRDKVCGDGLTHAP